MPHMYVEYTNNLQGLNEAALMEALNATVCGHPTVSDEADVKTRIAAVLKSVIPAQAGLEVQLSVDIVDMDKPSYFKGKL